MVPNLIVKIQQLVDSFLPPKVVVGVKYSSILKRDLEFEIGFVILRAPKYVYPHEF